MNNLAATLEALGRFVEAAEIYESFARQVGKTPNVLDRLGKLRLAAGDPDEGIAVFTELVSLAPAQAGAWLNLGNAHIARGDKDEAVSCYRKALACDPGSALAHYNLAVVQEASGEVAAASESYRAVVAIEPGYALAYNNLGSIALREGDLAQADEQLSAAITAEPRLAIAYHNLGLLREAQKRLSDAVDCYEKAMDLMPGLADTHVSLGNLLRDLGRVPQAEQVLRKGLAQHPDNMRLQSSLAHALAVQDRCPEAVDYYRKVVAAEPESVQALGDLAGALMKQGEAGQALEVLDKALNLAPHDGRALAYRSAAEVDASDGDGAAPTCDYARDILTFDLQVPKDYENRRAFHVALQAEVEACGEAEWEPINRSTRGGWQREVKLDSPGPALAAFEALLRATIDDALTCHGGVDDYWRAVPRDYKIVLWETTIERNGYQQPHFHQSGWLSGVYYLQVPESEADQAGWIEFGRPGYGFKVKGDPPVRLVEPVEGSLLLFPSYFFHRTLPFEGQGQRISLAFNIIPTSA